MILINAKQLLRGAYLQNRVVDFSRFLHADWYGGAGFTINNSASSGHYLGRERISLFPWQPIGIFSFCFREMFFVTLPDVPAKFGAHGPVSAGVDREQTDIQTLLKF